MKNIFGFICNGGLRFELITRFRQSQIALPICSFMLMLLFCFLLINGCRKDSSPSDENLLQGNQALHASAVAGYQTLGAGVSYPLKALQLASPTGSVIHGLTISKNLSHSIGSALLKSNSDLTNSFEFVPYLNLYGGDEFNGNILLMSFYSDAAGTQSAGSITVTLPTDITNPLDPTSYASYPANITIDLNITGGNLPCKGNLLISFTGGTGANTMTGTNTLTRDNVVFTLNLALDNQMNATGTITIQESGATIKATNVQGQAFGDLSCDITINPYGWIGTGVLNLITGSMSAQVNTGSGTSLTTSDSLGSLNINYADGTKEIVVNALSANLTGGGNSGGSSTANYNAPLIFTDRSIMAINNKGQSIGYQGTDNTVPVYWATPTAQPVLLHVPAGYNNIELLSINDNGQIVGNGSDPYNGGNSHALYWANNIAQPQKLAIPINAYSSEANSINNSGQIVGDAMTNSAPGWVCLYWASPTDTFHVIQPPAGTKAERTSFIAPNGQIIGNALWAGLSSNTPFWVSFIAQPAQLNVLAGDNISTPMSVNAAGLIVGASDSHAVTWASTTAPAQALPHLPGASANWTGIANSINTEGVIVGGLGENFQNGVIWENGQAQDLNTLFPSGSINGTLGAAILITDQGWILGTFEAGGGVGGGLAQYILIPK